MSHAVRQSMWCKEVGFIQWKDTRGNKKKSKFVYNNNTWQIKIHIYKQ